MHRLLGVIGRVCVEQSLKKVVGDKKCAKGTSPSICQGLPSPSMSFQGCCVCVNVSVRSRGLHGYKTLQVVLPDGCVPLLVGGLQPLSMTGSRS